MPTDTLSNPRNKTICFPCESEAEYRDAVENSAALRHLLLICYARFPELFPAAFAAGFTWHDTYHSRKLDVMFRLLRLRETGEIFLARPSCYLPSAVARTEGIEKALSFRRWNVPFAALAYVFGRDAMYYYRVWASWGRNSLVGARVKDPERFPQHLVVDEKHTWLSGEKRYLATTVGGGCILGAELAQEATTAALETAYGVFAAEAREVSADYAPESVCSDGWAATRAAVAGFVSVRDVGVVLFARCLEDSGTLRRRAAARALKESVGSVRGGDEAEFQPAHETVPRVGAERVTWRGAGGGVKVGGADKRLFARL
jgi:hypothetical protein